jgi:glycosyltransferase involved in cell wall biosynthesis
MNIVYVADSDLPSTAANSVQILKMVGAFAELGHLVTLLAPWHRRRVRSGDELARLRRDMGLAAPFSFHYLPFFSIRGRLRGSYFVVAATAARALSPDLVFTRNARVGAWCVRLGLDVVLESHAVSQSPRLLRALRDLSASPHLRRWVFISERLRRLHAERVPLPAGRTLVAHDAVDLRGFEPRLPAGEARARMGLDGSRPIVMFCGHLYPGRGAELVVDVAAARPDADFVFVGGNEQDIGRVRAHAGGAANVRFVGHRPHHEVPTWLQAADVLVMPHTSHLVVSDGLTRTSDYASPMKLFEYMAAGRAIVATRFPSVEEVLRDGDNGLLVPPDDVNALAAGIATALASPALAARLGEAARADAARHTWSRRATAVLDGLAPAKA